MAIGISFAVILGLIILSVPVAICFLCGSLLYVLLTGMSPGGIAPGAFFALDSTTLLAIPLFLIGGMLMEISGIAEKLIDFASALLAKVKGGLAATIPVACMFFGALSGSGTAAVAALGSIMIPRLEKLGWDRRYTAALMAASGPLGFMIPPNMTAILYGVISNTSVAALFLSTIIPGFIWCSLYLIINRILYKKYFKENEDFQKLMNQSVKENVKKSFKESIPAFIMPLIILGGIYGGIFTATEAGAVACVYAIIIGVFIYKVVDYKKFSEMTVKTGKTIGSILIIFPMVNVFTRFLIIEGVPQAVASFLLGITSNQYAILLFINIIFLVSGMFLSSGVITLVLTPLMMPTAVAIGLNPIQMGVMLFTAVGIGTITPPMAMNLFVSSKVSGVKFQDMLKPLWPLLFFGAVPVLLLVTFIPLLSLWLPKIVMGAKAIGL
ncbi:TRAP transporter large permease [Maledivibacter halophilus]|uniref:C4-dicarboxylate transporter, DctM subunit n=1 Tax=Maledivibacter halophilus TaxID=36842 RepID=A0A1T5M283_9FIRM|nr:TRAP transporter large permease [Maledivibacter halophilus]SKC82362.1 C4-dicarboxylate transporter, DctM subunit [Maledivibacter halophilus]